MHRFLNQLADSGVAQSIIMELTEDALVATQRFQRSVLPTLRGPGVRVSIDDFGTGYSSLSTLADITADEVKVDRAFITSIHSRPRSQGILRPIESLCSALDVDMVAEGVETEEELAYLRSHSSIRFAQGFLFSRPQFIEALVQKESTAAWNHPVPVSGRRADSRLRASRSAFAFPADVTSRAERRREPKGLLNRRTTRRSRSSSGGGCNR